MRRTRKRGSPGSQSHLCGVAGAHGITCSRFTEAYGANAHNGAPMSDEPISSPLWLLKVIHSSSQGLMNASAVECHLCLCLEEILPI